MDLPRYFARTSATGTMKYRDVHWTLGLFPSPDAFPIGQADCRTWNEHGNAVFELSLKTGVRVPGRWLLVDSEFKPVE
jgi:hypothetical protein